MFSTYLASLAVSTLLNIALPALPEHPHGIYMTSFTAQGERGQDLVDRMKDVGGNMVVIDIQDSNGQFAYHSEIPEVEALQMNGKTLKDLPALIRKLHMRGIYAVARYVAFKNSYLAPKKTEWALKDKTTGRPFTARDGLVWLDPSNPELVDFIVKTSVELAEIGFDEIQYDYVRFPEAGAKGYIGYAWQSGEEDRERVITEFVATVADALHKKDVKVGLDLFGVIAWNNGYDQHVIGQNLTDLSKHVDVIYPMVYPSHFGDGFSGIKNPAGQPYYMVSESTKKFLEFMRGGRAVVRPWLQGFTYRVPNYGTWYVADQIKALKDLGIEEFVVWNASNMYDAALPAFNK